MSSHIPRKRVSGYTRRDGTYVPGYYRRRPGSGTVPPRRRSSSPGMSLGELLGLLFVAALVLGALARSVG